MKKAIKQVRISLDGACDGILTTLAASDGKTKTEVIRELIEDAGRRRLEDQSKTKLILMADRIEALHEAVHQLKEKMNKGMERTEDVIEVVRGIEKDEVKRDSDSQQILEALFGVVARMDVAVAALIAGINDVDVRKAYQVALSDPSANLYSSALKRAEAETKAK